MKSSKPKNHLFARVKNFIDERNSSELLAVPTLVMAVIIFSPFVFIEHIEKVANAKIITVIIYSVLIIFSIYYGTILIIKNEVQVGKRTVRGWFVLLNGILILSKGLFTVVCAVIAFVKYVLYILH